MALKKSVKLFAGMLLLALGAQGSLAKNQKIDAASAGGVATFAGGCFWCMEAPFDKTPGVLSTTSGYTGGPKKNPTYEEVSRGGSGHIEAVEITFDPAKISYAELVEIFWRQIDPTDPNGQFADQGSQYESRIFYHSKAQEEVAIASRKKLAAAKRFSKPIVTKIVPATPFYPAEDYHQDYYKKNPERYSAYRKGSGREGFLEKIWGKSK